MQMPSTHARTPLPVKPFASLRARLVGGRRSDREFLPAALEILDTPPSPIGLWLLVATCVFVAVALGWAYVSRIDIIAVAQGKIQPTGRVKLIQPLETSRVLAAKVENGDRVRAGQVLVTLDPTEAEAEVAQLAGNLSSARAEILRRDAALAAARSRELPAPTTAARLAIDWPATIVEAFRRREERVYAADMLSLASQVESLKAQAEQKNAERERLRTMIEAETTLIATMKDRVTMRQALIGTNAGSKVGLIEALEAMQGQKTTLMQQKGQLMEAEASLAVNARDIDHAYRAFIADNAQKLADAERQAGDLTERLRKAEARLDRTVLSSPIDGIVQASTLTTVGQVVTAGQALMRIVSDKDALEIECYLPNRDIGFVKVGDTAVLKIESFPFTRYGTVDAVVTKLARDAIPEPDADQIEKDGTHNAQAMTASGGQRMQNLVFPVTLRPLRTAIDVDGATIPLGAGMSVTAEIRTGSRRILEYVFSPLAKTASEAFKER